MTNIRGARTKQLEVELQLEAVGEDGQVQPYLAPVVIHTLDAIRAGVVPARFGHTRYTQVVTAPGAGAPHTMEGQFSVFAKPEQWARVLRVQAFVIDGALVGAPLDPVIDHSRIAVDVLRVTGVPAARRAEDELELSDPITGFPPVPPLAAAAQAADAQEVLAGLRPPEHFVVELAQLAAAPPSAEVVNVSKDLLGVLANRSGSAFTALRIGYRRAGAANLDVDVLVLHVTTSTGAQERWPAE